MSSDKPGGRDRLPEDGQQVIFWVEGGQPGAGTFHNRNGFPRFKVDGGALQFAPERIEYWVTLSEARAAGEMREALRGFVDSECHCDESSIGTCCQCVARAALALAEGKQ